MFFIVFHVFSDYFHHISSLKNIKNWKKVEYLEVYIILEIYFFRIFFLYLF